MTKSGTVCAVVVTYQPEQVALRELLDALKPQVEQVVVIDNASAPLSQASIRRLVDAMVGVLITFQENRGLAAAQNEGIAWAREHDFAYVLLLDQDSLPAPGMVAALVAASEHLSTEQAVAAVGPYFHDLHTDRGAPFVRIDFPFNRKLWCEQEGQAIACDFLISSGTLIALRVIDEVGAMDAGLFIDNVDLEWSFRARARGYSLFGVCAATMHHRLGDARRPVFFGRARIVVHGPLRLYYMMRNRTCLYRLAHVPRIWVAQDIPRVFIKLFLFGVLLGPRWRNLRYMLRGLGDGLRGRTGQAPDALLR